MATKSKTYTFRAFCRIWPAPAGKEKQSAFKVKEAIEYQWCAQLTWFGDASTGGKEPSFSCMFKNYYKKDKIANLLTLKVTATFSFPVTKEYAIKTIYKAYSNNLTVDWGDENTGDNYVGVQIDALGYYTGTYRYTNEQREIDERERTKAG